MATLRCRAATSGFYQCTAPAKGETEMFGSGGKRATLPACGTHLRMRRQMAMSYFSGSNYWNRTPVYRHMKP